MTQYQPLYDDIGASESRKLLHAAADVTDAAALVEEGRPLLINSSTVVEQTQNSVHAQIVDATYTINSKPEESEKNAEKKQPRKRVIGLDILRGLTVFMMIIVNNQIDGAFWPLEHADWNGLTPTDLIFPFFLWVGGYAIGIVFNNAWKDFPCWSEFIKRPMASIREYRALVKERESKGPWCRFFGIPLRREKYERVATWYRIFKRSILLFLIGFSFSVLSHKFNFLHVRYFGVLQRIAFCYFCCSMLEWLVPYLFMKIFIVLALQVIYIGFMFGLWVPGPGCGRGVITPECSAEGLIDTILIGRDHIYNQRAFDPEGPLSNLSAVTTMYLGVIFFKLAYRNKDNEYKRLAHWFVLGLALVAVGLIMHFAWFPLNKPIWSTSYAIFAAGLAGIALGLVSFVVDTVDFGRAQKHVSYLYQPFIWIGSNPLLMYCVPTYVSIMIYRYIFVDGTIIWNGTRSIGTTLYKILAQSWIQPRELSSLLWAVLFEMLFIPMAAFLYWRKWFVKL